MSSQQDKPPLEVQVPSRFGRFARNATGAMIAAVTGPIVVVAVGLIAWNVAVGFGILIGPVVGILVGSTLRKLGDRRARMLAGGLGGAVGGYFAICQAEICPPGTVEWAIRGGIYGVTAAAVIGIIGGLARPRT